MDEKTRQFIWDQQPYSEIDKCLDVQMLVPGRVELAKLAQKIKVAETALSEIAGYCEWVSRQDEPVDGRSLAAFTAENARIALRSISHKEDA